MIIHINSMLRSLKIFILLCLMAPLSLWAQLDPRLQVASTDFLDLYQQSTTSKVKPEVMTLFDFSTSMRAIMYHPAFRNVDISGSGGSSGTLSFSLHAGGSASQVYTIKAVSQIDPKVYTQMVVTVGGSAVPGTPTNENRTDTTTGSAKRRLYTSISAMTISPTGTISNGTTYTFSATITLRCTTDSNNNATAKPLSEYMAKAGLTSLNGGILWTVTGYPASAAGSTDASPSDTSLTTWTSSAQTFRWTAATGTAVPGSVSATLSNISLATCIQLIKPNGEAVTSSDANAANNSLPGGTAGAADVRNWVRAASHARFGYRDSGVQRTVDIPIPWKVMDLNSSGNPVSSATVYDPYKTTTSPNGTTSTYGSGQYIEVDQVYRVSTGTSSNWKAMLDGNKDSVELMHTTYNDDYMNWVFKGKYADGPYSGKYIVYDAANASLVGGQELATWGQGFGIGIPSGQTLQVPSYGEAIYPADRPYLGNVNVIATSYVLPARTRIQAIKESAIKVWIKYQNEVLWAYRYLGDGGSNTMSISSTTTMNNTTSLGAFPEITGDDTAWTLLNGNSLAGMQRIALMEEIDSTPLTYSVSRSLAQFCDPGSVFNSIETGAQKPSQCMNHYLFIFTDGADNGGNPTEVTPYLNASLQGNAWEGNAGIIANKTWVDQGGGSEQYWNLFTFAAIAAHLSDSSVKDPNGVSHYMAAPASYPATGKRSEYLPYSILERGSGNDHVTFEKPHRFTVMTVGISLGGTYLDASSPKFRLFSAAAIGDPTTQTWNLNNLLPFDSIPDPADSSRLLRKPGTTNFFDGSDPAKLLTSLDVAIQQTTRPSNVNSTVNPNLPFIGAALGREVYLGKFKPPANGGVVWPGDLMMFGTRPVNDQTLIVDKNDNLATAVDAATAIWTTSSALAARNWYDRKLYTRIPGATVLTTFSDVGTAFSDSTSGLKNFVATNPAATETTRQRVIQFAAGGDTTGVMGTSSPLSGRPLATRSSIMGDIINSSPGVLEYQYSDVSGNLPSTLTSGSVISTNSTIPNHFRLILVGTNQGWLHAFGEVSNVTKVPDPADATKMVDKVKASVDELWAFMPTDFLANLDYITQTGNNHVFMVDGTPSIYFLDLPPSSGGRGNGVLDLASDSVKQERAIAIIGLGKGGRSYYALDIHNPFSPTLKWSLVPDESASFPANRIANGCSTSLADVRALLANWGFSTCTPALGRIMFNGVLRDVVFLGGGFSNPEIEANFADPSTGIAPAMGRSIIALDVYTGEVLATTQGSSQAPIAAGLIPFEFFLNSGMAQRAYYLDYKGGLWSWGKQAVSLTGTYENYRTDSSELTEWSVRKVAQDGGGKNAIYSTLPAPFRAGAFPGQGKNGAPAPAAVGIAMISGDRHNPLDYLYSDGSRPTQERLTVVFDRQDHQAWDSTDGAITDSSLISAGTWVAPASSTSLPTSPTSMQAGDALITPGNSAYYLAPHDAQFKYSTPSLGYYVNLPAAATFIPKGINSPLVVAGSLFYSYFSPEVADRCSGGSGLTFANLICDVYNPIVADSRTTVSCRSGTQFTWTGVASDFVTIGTQGVLQAGVVPAINPAPGQSLTTIQLKTILGNRLERFPKVRTWRTIH